MGHNIFKCLPVVRQLIGCTHNKNNLPHTEEERGPECEYKDADMDELGDNEKDSDNN